MSLPTKTHRYPLKNIFAWTFLIVFTIVMFLAIMASAQAADKQDEPCTGLETAGRCADKCPAGYYQQGMDKETGAAICKPPGTTDPSQTNQTSQNVPDTELPQFEVPPAENWGK